ncbi:Uma2 family endonuclease [Altericista sp. CCNU0014]|uniref:Uma2 family endonuclease n=1 Tax=Altericista sp. CCNU0014 TaxID=3082949 RepID=UPI0038515BAD
MLTVTHPDRPQHSSGVMLQGITWQTYQSLVQELESQPAKRLTYDNGVLEIFMPLPPHETYKRLLGRLVEIVTEEMNLEIRSLSASTWSRKDLLKGVEADECYYIQNEAIVRGKMEIDLAIDPPPDLAIEIDISNPSLPRLPIYAALGVPEVWQFDGESFKILGLTATEYIPQCQSLALPMVTVEAVQRLLIRAQEMGETSWAKAVRQWAKEQGDRVV